MTLHISPQGGRVPVTDDHQLSLIASAVAAIAALAKSFHTDWKAARDKDAVEKRMNEIAIAVVNPKLQEERHVDIKKDLEHISQQLLDQPRHIRDAAIAGVEAGARLLHARDLVK